MGMNMSYYEDDLNEVTKARLVIEKLLPSLSELEKETLFEAIDEYSYRKMQVAEWDRRE